MQLVRGRIASIGWRRHSAVAAAAAVSWTIAAELPAVDAVAAAAAADAVAAGGDESASVVAAAAAGETQRRSHSDDGGDGSHRPRVNCDDCGVHYHRRQLRHPSTQSRFPTPNCEGIRCYRHRHAVHVRAEAHRRKMTVPID